MMKSHHNKIKLRSFVIFQCIRDWLQRIQCFWDARCNKSVFANTCVSLLSIHLVLLLLGKRHGNDGKCLPNCWLPAMLHALPLHKHPIITIITITTMTTMITIRDKMCLQAWRPKKSSNQQKQQQVVHLPHHPQHRHSPQLSKPLVLQHLFQALPMHLIMAFVLKWMMRSKRYGKIIRDSLQHWEAVASWHLLCLARVVVATVIDDVNRHPRLHLQNLPCWWMDSLPKWPTCWYPIMYLFVKVSRKFLDQTCRLHCMLSSFDIWKRPWRAALIMSVKQSHRHAILCSWNKPSLYSSLFSIVSWIQTIVFWVSSLAPWCVNLPTISTSCRQAVSTCCVSRSKCAISSRPSWPKRKRLSSVRKWGCVTSCWSSWLNGQAILHW